MLKKSHNYITMFQVGLLSCVCVGLQACYEEAVIDPLRIAEQLKSERCATNWSQVQEFYKNQREADNREFQYPDPSKRLHKVTMQLHEIAIYNYNNILYMPA